MIAYNQDAAGTVCIVGLGFVGLPLAMNFLARGYRVIALDTDKRKLEALGKGSSHVQDVPDRQILGGIASGRLAFTDRYAMASAAETVIICVPTPLAPDGAPDLGYLLDACRSLSPVLADGQLVVIESSTYPGTTAEQVKPLLETNGKRAGTDFFLAYSPERIDPGNRSLGIHQIPKVVSGVTDACLERVASVYRTAFDSVIPLSSTEAAETMKLLENSYRFINISFVNEIAMLCERLGLNAWEIIEAAATKPYGFSAFYPGPGIGGHCIPVDPLYLQWKAAQSGAASRFIEAAQQINRRMPAYLVQEIEKHLPAGTTVDGARILIYGVAYKQNIADARESTAMAIMEALLARGADVRYYDPYLASVQLPDGSVMARSELSAAALEEADCLLVLTHHDELPVRLIAEHSSFVYDTRNVVAAVRPGAKLVTLGNGARKDR
ncbi:nucleotide sugar dehydrogenase [Paenibacillus glycinis]|uniref:Nucleotide sugar dehydrogenase n=1 Tax=Paenibacillus glycinis TaxID=2697035 RepID=A0ABW9XXU3_9BACL|nr:nucleotide sugar dehydrogenase [Paenibacillus glycinis]NBD27336.1 nucleotide sugar dehydrogenase [Paenibacillus glycinis]